jgi:signal transduction histidine kinase
LLLNHLANVVEWSGYAWADTVADQLSIIVPMIWALFLFEIGRSYLTAKVDAGAQEFLFLLERVPASVACLSANSTLEAFSRAWRRGFPASVVGNPLAASLPVRLPALEVGIAESLRAGKEVTSSEEAARDELGRMRYFRWALRRWSQADHPRPGTLLVLEEITEDVEGETKRALAAEELSRAQRMAHLGQLAAGAAHDFNNLLLVIQSAAWELEQGSQAKEAAEDLKRALIAAAELTNAMLKFGKAEGGTRGPVDLRGLLTELEGLFAHALGRRHKLVVSLPPPGTEVTVRGSPSRLQQAILNLVTNARDAMPEGGEIALSLSVEGEQALVTVQDSGVGIPESLRDQLFTPFFTTKGAQGTGLGLRVVQSVVNEHGGKIAFESEAGAGTTFRVWLPLSWD